VDDPSDQNADKVRLNTRGDQVSTPFVSTLALSNLVTAFPITVTSLLLIEISQSFGVEVGAANQVRAAASTAAVVMGLIMGGLSVRFNHKALFLVGLGLLGLSAACCALAPTFLVLLVAYGVYGVSQATVRPIAHALIGRFVSLQQRPKVTSYLIVGMASAYLVGSALVNVISEWRLMFLAALLPLAVATLVLAVVSIPATPTSHVASPQYRRAFTDVLFNRSALACLIGGVLYLMPTNAVLASLSVSFFRQIYGVEKFFMSVAVLGISSIAIVGSLVGGRLVNRIGRKRVTTLSAFLLGVFTLLLINVPTLWGALIVWTIAGFFMGSIRTSLASLSLEQAPAFRATMMSLSEVSLNLAQALGNALAGLLLLAFNYHVVSLMGVFAIIGAGIFHVFTRDPTQDA
jgi:DHA1 family inner membrane transport protein